MPVTEAPKKIVTLEQESNPWEAQAARFDFAAQKLNPSTGELDSNPVNATSVTKSDSKISSDKVVVWTNSSCLVIDKDNPPDCVAGDDPRLVSASTEPNISMSISGSPSTRSCEIFSRPPAWVSSAFRSCARSPLSNRDD